MNKVVEFVCVCVCVCVCVQRERKREAEGKEILQDRGISMHTYKGNGDTDTC